MCLFSQLLSPQIPNASYPHPHPPAASFLFYKSDGDLKTLIITWIHFGESQSLHSCTRFPPSLTSSRTRFHWLSFLFPRSLLILCWIIPLVIQTIIALILFFKSWLEPTSLANYLFFFLCFSFAAKFHPHPWQHWNYWCQGIQWPLCCQIQWLVSLPILADLSAVYHPADHSLLPSWYMVFIWFPGYNTVLVFLHRHWLLLFSLLCWILLFPLYLSVGVSLVYSLFNLHSLVTFISSPDLSHKH